MTTANSTSEAVRYERDGEVGRVVIDQPGRPVNVLDHATLDALSAALDAAEADKPNALLVVSGKPGTFVAGADVFALTAMPRGELLDYLQYGQDLFTRLAKFPAPTAAVLAGATLGGGLELALACDYRTATPNAKIGLPEVTLGVVPAWGGCVRLPRLIGPAPAAELITRGRVMDAESARRAGVVDAVSQDAQEAAKALFMGGNHQKPSRVPHLADAANLRRTLAGARQELEAFSGPHAAHYPAPLRALEAIRAGQADGVDAGFEAERTALADLRETPTGRNLLRIFALKQNAKKAAVRAAGGTARKVGRVAVVGGGTMGAGIAHAMLRAGLPVDVIEANDAAAAAAGQRVSSLVDADAAKGRLSDAGATDAKQRLAVHATADAARSADLIVEAVVENLAVKRGLFAELDRIAKPDAILATNTSSLSVSDLAAATADPSRVVGLHFFNPVPRMPLVEIVRGKQSSDDAVATAVAVTLSLGKTPVVVNDAPGFVVNRVLMPYLSEAARAATEGCDLATADANVRAWGMPMGPFELMDTIGLDVIAGIFDAMHPHLGDRVSLPPALAEAARGGALGRKSGRGFYVWPGDRAASPEPNGELLDALRNAADARADVSAERFVLPMCNESARVLEQQVVQSADAVDLATLLGLGLAPFRGGVAGFVDDQGAEEVVRELESLSERHGERFAPAPLLRRAADEGKSLASYGGGAS